MVVPIGGSTRAFDSGSGVDKVATFANQMDKSYDGPPHRASLTGSNRISIMKLVLEVRHQVEGE